jgi:NAD(P)-dependent dehydrogenase (short-subunit alcohol dehydrogenase family)
VDITDATGLTGAITRFGEHVGRIDVLHFNPSATTIKGPLELTPDELIADLRIGVASLLTALQAARPFMSPGARILATGSMSADVPWSAAAAVGIQKAALRNLVKAIDAELRADGIRAMTLTVSGAIASGTRFAPELVAEALFDAANVPEPEWRDEVRYDG